MLPWRSGTIFAELGVRDALALALSTARFAPGFGHLPGLPELIGTAASLAGPAPVSRQAPDRAMRQRKVCRHASESETSCRTLRPVENDVSPNS
ncbi:hypothetical protein ACVCIC_28455 [Burkholderia glumae]